MSDERVVSLAEVKGILESEQKERAELTNEQKISLDHATRIAKLSQQDAKRLYDDLKSFDFVSDPVAIKIVDLLPAYPEDMRALFAKERLILDKKQIDQLLSAVKKYV
ncbi:MAG TPA: RNA polymerase Rpb4 family protein [Methanomassiliicoccales archaeon]|nr:RNA polymerase Rpb4 family protein [Methanomassiliicoccales archaeon]